MKSCVLVILIACFAGGCGPHPDKGEPKKPGKKSVARETIDGFTGKTAVNNLKRAKPKIDAAHEVENEKQQNIDELTKP